MKVKVNKTEYPAIIVEEFNIKSNHTDINIKKYLIEFTIYDDSDKKSLEDILSEKVIHIIDGESKKFSISSSSYSNSPKDNYQYQKYRLEIEEIEKLYLEILNIDGVEFKPYFYDEKYNNGLTIFSKIKTDKKGFDFLNQKKLSSQPCIIIRVGISSKPIQVNIHPAREWSESNGEYKLIVAFSQILVSEKYNSLADEIAHIRDYSIGNKSFSKTLLLKLVSKGILEQSESEIILKETDDNFNKEFIEYHRVKDID